MVKIGTPMTSVGKKAILCGSGELGKEVALELQRFGVEVVALDKYENAPAMQVAHRSYVLSMLDGERLREIIEAEKPDYIIPEVEAIATPTLVELEKEGYNVIPTANATLLTMNRKGIRQLAAEELGIPTSPYCFAATREEFDAKSRAWYYAEVLKNARKAAGITQQQLAEKIGKKREYIAMLEKGETDMQLSTFIMISEAVGLKFALTY